MRSSLLPALLVVTLAGCATSSQVPADATASADALYRYLVDRNVDLTPATVFTAEPIEGAELAVYRLGPAFQQASRTTVSERDFDPRSYYALGARGAEADPNHRRRGGRIPQLDVYTFDGPADLDRLADALGPRADGTRVYAAGSVVVVLHANGFRRLSRALGDAFGTPQAL